MTISQEVGQAGDVHGECPDAATLAVLSALFEDQNCPCKAHPECCYVAGHKDGASVAKKNPPRCCQIWQIRKASA